MTRLSLNDQGIAHYLIPAIVVVGLVVGGTFMVVAKANHHNSQSALLTTNKTSSDKSKLTQPTSTPPAIAATTPEATSTTKASSGSTATSKSTTSVAPTTIKPTPTPPAPVPTPTQTPLSALTTVITNLENGTSSNVTAKTVNVPGPITTAQARPIVFTANGQTYFAYTQGRAANFNTAPAQTAGIMAIVTATVSAPALTQAHLDKSNNFVDPDFVVVGYSTGGN